MPGDFNTSHSVVQPLRAACLGDAQNIFIKRDDLIHPIVSGNKWRKLEFTIEKASKEHKTHLVTSGGAYSNHLIATACAGASLGFKTSCFVRGEELSDQSNHYLFAAKLYGMNLIPVSREEYRNKEALFSAHFGSDPDAFFVAEGGESEEAQKGVAKIISELDFAPGIIVHASATATTAIGLGMGLKEHPDHLNNTQIHSVAVLKNGGEQANKVEALGLTDQVKIIGDYTFGGYAKTTPELLNFCKDFISQTGIMIDPVYTGKALWGLRNLLQTGRISPDKKVLFVHTGGTLGMFSEAFRN